MSISRLRHYRQQLEEILRAELMQLEADVQKAADWCEDARREVASVVDRQLHAMEEGVGPEEVERRYAEVTMREQDAKQAERTLHELHDRWEAHREALIEAGRERRKLERLEQREAVRARMRLLRVEQQQLDEAAQIRFLRREHEASVGHAQS